MRSKVLLAIWCMLVVLVSSTFAEDELFSVRQSGSEVDDFEMFGDSSVGESAIFADGIRLHAFFEEDEDPAMATAIYRFIDIDRGTLGFSLKIKHSNGPAKMNIRRVKAKSNEPKFTTYELEEVGNDKQCETFEFGAWEHLSSRDELEIRLVAINAKFDVGYLELRGYGYRPKVEIVERHHYARTPSIQRLTVYDYYYPSVVYERDYYNRCYGYSRYAISYSCFAGIEFDAWCGRMRVYLTDYPVRVFCHHWRPRRTYLRTYCVIDRSPPTVVYNLSDCRLRRRIPWYRTASVRYRNGVFAHKGNVDEIVKTRQQNFASDSGNRSGKMRKASSSERVRPIKSPAGGTSQTKAVVGQPKRSFYTQIKRPTSSSQKTRSSLNARTASQARASRTQSRAQKQEVIRGTSVSSRSRKTSALSRLGEVVKRQIFSSKTKRTSSRTGSVKSSSRNHSSHSSAMRTLLSRSKQKSARTRVGSSSSVRSVQRTPRTWQSNRPTQTHVKTRRTPTTPTRSAPARSTSSSHSSDDEEEKQRTNRSRSASSRKHRRK